MAMNLTDSLSSINELLNGLPDDQRRLLLSILTTFPLGIINHFIYGKIFRLLYALIFGFLVQYYMFGFACINVSFATILCYVLMKICDRKKIGWIVTIYAFLHLSSIHIYRMIVDYGGWTMDVSLIMMMTLTKFTSFAFCYSDGGKDEQSLTKFTLKHSVKEFTLLEYFGYIYFYPTSIMGPFFEFSDFRDFINREGDYKNIPVLKAIKEGGFRLLGGFFFAILYLIVKPFSSVNFYFENSGSKYFPNCLIYLSFLFQKFKYYTGFLFTESICLVSGISYQKEFLKDEHKEINNFNKVNSINIKVTESTVKLSKFFQNWNISIHHWLKKYVHFRIYEKTEDYKDRAKSTRAKIITFMISGLWHGFYPSYYIIFTHFSLGLLMEENITYIKKNFNKGNFYNFVLDWIYFLVSLFSLPYVLGILESLYFSSMLKFGSTVYFLPTILLILVIAYTNKIIKIEKRKLAKKE
jgi:lysophospholipid acyltransferase